VATLGFQEVLDGCNVVYDLSAEDLLRGVLNVSAGATAYLGGRKFNFYNQYYITLMDLPYLRLLEVKLNPSLQAPSRFGWYASTEWRHQQEHVWCNHCLHQVPSPLFRERRRLHLVDGSVVATSDWHVTSQHLKLVTTQ
jgi:hypothetical protein